MSDDSKFYLALYVLIAVAGALAIYAAHLRAECGYYDEPVGACKQAAALSSARRKEGKP